MLQQRLEGRIYICLLRKKKSSYFKICVLKSPSLPPLSRYILGVRGFSETCHYSLTLSHPSSELQCPSRCSLHGECIYFEDQKIGLGECECRGGYEGEECEERDAPLVLGEREGGYVEEGMWNYFHVVGVTARSLVVEVVEVGGGDGDCDVYIKGGQRPGMFDFDYFDVGTDEVRLWI